MSWSSLQSRTSSLPVIIAGPIVRMVTQNQVIVWIAMSSSYDVKLQIKNTNNQIVGTGSSATPLWIGAYLYVTIVQIKNLNLAANTKYYYDILFDRNSSIDTLTSNGILSFNGNGIGKIVFTGQALPSFVVPPANLDDLRIIHT